MAILITISVPDNPFQLNRNNIKVDIYKRQFLLFLVLTIIGLMGPVKEHYS
jgi:hypothetical protein